jgi:hypothetical protein
MLLDFLAFRHGQLLDPAELPFTSCGRCEVASIFQLRVAAIRRSRVLAGIVPDSGGSFPLLGHNRKNAQA